jgi:hypothetical protein
MNERKGIFLKGVFNMKSQQRTLIVFISFILLCSIVFSNYVFASHSLQAQPNNPPLVEADLDGAKITLTLTGDQFKSTLSLSDVGLRNQPPGVTIATIVRTTNNQAEVTLSYNNSDFDVDYTNFQIGLRGSGVVYQTHGTFSNTMTIYANSVSMTASSVPNELYENTLNGSLIDLIVQEITFGNVSKNDFTLNNAPAGTSISSVRKHNDTEVTLTLQHDGTDFDSTYPNFSVTVSAAAVSIDSPVTSNSLPIYAINEVEGQQTFHATGQSYPTLIENAGYRVRDLQLFLNIELFTSKTVNRGQQVTFRYFIDIFNKNGSKIGHLGTINQPLSVTGDPSTKSAQIKNQQVALSSPLPNEYRIIVTIYDTTIN